MADPASPLPDQSDGAHDAAIQAAAQALAGPNPVDVRDVMATKMVVGAYLAALREHEEQIVQVACRDCGGRGCASCAGSGIGESYPVAPDEERHG